MSSLLSDIPEHEWIRLIYETDEKLTTIADSLKAMNKNIKTLTLSLSAFLDTYAKILSQQGLS